MSTFETDLREDVRNLHIKDLLSIPGDAYEAIKGIGNSDLGKSLLSATGNILRRSRNGIVNLATKAANGVVYVAESTSDFVTSIPERIEDFKIGLEEVSIANKALRAGEAERELLAAQSQEREFEIDFHGNKIYTEPSQFEKFPTIAILAWSSLKHGGNLNIHSQDVDYMSRKGKVNEYGVLRFIHEKVNQTMDLRSLADDDYYEYGTNEYLRNVTDHANNELSEDVYRINRGREAGAMDELNSRVQLAKIDARREYVGKEDGIGAEYFYMNRSGSFQHRELVMVSAIKLLIADGALSGTLEYDEATEKYVYYQNSGKNGYVLDGSIDPQGTISNRNQAA